MKLIKTVIAMSLLAILWVNTAHAQAPQGFNYQAVVRNSSGVILANQAITFRISLLQGTITGTSAYTETHAVTSDPNGLVNFVIGKGTVVSGLFNQIKWGNGPFFVKVELDPLGGTAFVVMSTTELMSVPYALYAEKSGGVNVFTYNKAFSASTIDIMRGDSWKGTYNLNYLCGDREVIHFSNSALPSGMTISHSGSGKQLDFADTITVSTTAEMADGTYPITLIATTASGTKAIQNININVLKLANVQGNYTYVDTLRSGNDNYYPIVGVLGPYTTTVSPIVNNQFTISNFGPDSLTFTANVYFRSNYIVNFNLVSMTYSGCTYSGAGAISSPNTYSIRYTKTCGSNTVYGTSWLKWW